MSCMPKREPTATGSLWIVSSECLRRDSPTSDHNALEPSFAQLKDKTRDELLAMQTYPRAQLKSYERALRTAKAILTERV